jgi:hypothetical protein
LAQAVGSIELIRRYKLWQSSDSCDKRLALPAGFYSILPG